jgi:phosphatidylserine/phosphatidylglycerophosphate/cardiolipin synthase-like enzyme
VEAERDVVIAAPYLQQGHGLSAGPIAEALKGALRRGVDVDIMSTARSLSTLNGSELRRGAPGRLRFFRPAANIAHEKKLGSHAKFCVVDACQAYIGSANLTGPGLGEHVEIGLLVRGEIAIQLRTFWEFCVHVGLFVQVDGHARSGVSIL